MDIISELAHSEVMLSAVIPSLPAAYNAHASGRGFCLMQPMLMIRSDIPGVVYINGRFAGEAGEDSAVSIPVSSRGTLYVELRPLQGGYLPLARRIALAQGQVVPASLEGQDGLFLVHWPGAVLDLQLSPECARSAPLRAYERLIDGLTVRLLRNGGAARLEISDGAAMAVHPLPDGAQPPELKQLAGGALLFSGPLDEGGRYALVVGRALDPELLRLSALDVEALGDGSVRALVDVDDQVGHVQLMTYRPSASGYELAQAEPMWASGAPKWPQTAEDTALAALQAARLGLVDEAGAYFAAGLPGVGGAALAEAARSDGAVALKYPLPTGEQAVGLLKLIGDNAAMVTPVSYRALARGGSQGVWRLESLELL